MARRDIVVIGASAGGVAALATIVRELPADLDAAVFVVLHLAPLAKSVLPAILGRDAKLPVVPARDRMPVRPGSAYVAPPGRHMVLEGGVMRLTLAARIDGHRPSVDALFCSAAAAYGPRVVGVILTGALDDGTAGLRAVKEAGGVAIVQSPDDAQYRSMPESALAHVAVDHCAPAAEIAALVAKVVGVVGASR
jgi:two-component system chemotaxis response regulator CheB